MNQGGKHAAAEPGRLENKRERRRGAAGRAAVLRRAPSDSDCSGETASLSADSGDRALRPAPLAPPRSAKTRSRRRGSEWEVLEGLKDGQRFEKRPDVFNGYLHKKRKWPLKGWHKRFFVVDGGILVYARSPTDVARGRLHGSVDVGLSVISAKARRRRIDIDADEFIYHLRAKTPDVFRTWLNVLKVHRLYRQHLLTFGARESAPKTHPPLEDLPTTENSSHSSLATEISTETSVENPNPDPDPSFTLISKTPCNIDSSVYSHKDHNTILNWQRDTLSKSRLVPLDFEDAEHKMLDLKLDFGCHSYRSMCSMKCATKYIDAFNRNYTIASLITTDAEKQMTTTNVDSPKAVERDVTLIHFFKNPIQSKDMTATSIIPNGTKNLDDNTNMDYGNELPTAKESPFLNKIPEPTTACFFFTRKKKVEVTDSLMKKSKKCTNLVKYRNVSEEPPLKNQTSKCMLLRKYKLTASKHVDTDKSRSKAVGCSADLINTNSNEVQVMTIKEHKASQKVATPSDYDKITEKLMISIFRRCGSNSENDIKFFIEKVVQDLYDIRFDQRTHPVKTLFRNLLEYWFKNTSVSEFKKAMTAEKSVERQSNRYLAKDENLSGLCVKTKSKETQFHGLSDIIGQYKHNKNAISTRPKSKNTIDEAKISVKCQSHKLDTASFEKERRIQELEKLLRSTVYVCELGSNNINKNIKEKDIKITKTLIDNLGRPIKKDFISDRKPIVEKSSSSAELPEIQDTINHLISETSIPADIAKEFFGAYLDVLMQDSSKSTTVSQSSDWEKISRDLPECEVVAEAVVKKVSKSMTTFNMLVDSRKDKVPQPTQNVVNETVKQVDPGQIYLKDVLDKVTTIFSKVKKIEDNTRRHNKPDPIINKREIKKKDVKNKFGRPVFKSKSDLIYENSDQNSLVINLSKYKLEQVSMFNDPKIRDMMSISIKLREKPRNHKESKRRDLSLKPDDAKPAVTNVDKCSKWLPFTTPLDSTSTDIFHKLSIDSNNVTRVGMEANIANIHRKSFFCNSEGTSNANRPCDESYNSFYEPTTTHTNYAKDSDKRENDELQSCYLMSIKKGPLATKFQSKIQMKRCDCGRLFIKSRETSPSKPATVDDSAEEAVSKKTTHKVIDENFILLLLENLTYLSRTVPNLHKDISVLYQKLKKKHKVVKNPTIQGLGLLGKIYSEDASYKDGIDRWTQCDPCVLQCNETRKDFKNVSTDTNVPKMEKQCASTYLSLKTNVATAVQTDAVDESRRNSLNMTNVESKASKTNKDDKITIKTETVTIHRKDQSTNAPEWLKTTKDATINTCIKYYLNEGNWTNPARMRVPTRLHRLDRDCFKKRTSPQLREELMKEISLLSTFVKVSTQSQTDRQLIRAGAEKCDVDFHVYQLFSSNQCGVKASSSMMISSSVDADFGDEMRTLYRCSSEPSYPSGLFSPTIRGPQAGFVSGTPGGRLAGWIIESGGPLESASRELGQAQLSVQQLQRLLDALELQQAHHDTDVSLEGASPNVKKDRRKFGLRKKKSNSKCASVDLAPPHIDPSSSHTALSSLSALTAPPSPGGGASSMPNSAASLPIACAAARPQSLPGAESLNTAQGPASLTSLTPDHQLREDFTVLAKDLVASLKGIVSSLVCERGRLRAAVEAAESPATGAVVAALRTNLTSALQQNSELRTRLSRIHDASDMADVMSVGNSDTVARQFQPSLSYSSSCVSASEFFDAEEHEEDDLKPEDVIAADEAGVIELDGDSSSEAGSLSSEEGSASSDNSDGAMLSAEQSARHNCDGGGRGPPWSRRTRLPAPRPAPGGPSLWNLLYKNIGKDLSQISMPVTINEPLNMLQRLCEELEYSELLDAAAASGSSVERAALVAAFAVSSYAASAHRAASKPFNPLLGETYECVRADRGFRFIAEQVSHHPPISACHAESPRWCFWQEARIKTKFWGKSMEFQPTGRVHVRLNTTGDHYTWNKVTTCVHNLFGGQRWVDQYGDMHIVCVGTDISAKLNFIKASSWSQTRHEVRGAVSDVSSGSRLRLAGRWSEALYAGEPPAARCLWRPGAMPPEHELYYGFTRFAMELNEMEPGMRELLPPTDTRFRPDQRALEEGDVESAEAFKLQLEQAQRERRREMPNHQPAWFRKTVEDGEETWVFSGEYWKAREAGFGDNAPRIW